ncbi:LysR family transcriptional regulator [Cohnella thailandensis]|jgi:Transcriptional regulator|uniref:LysR family transcriptional regulator n=1 Tax=Cohnella thailandensis TaxID=557557 RepID=A0A841SL76_9BACL|nr:LysR family transcriptional regulator [Cohnella thailandensis]MBB6632664.1 LysR family transcriptional regulator [Cohnella thailandensis]MBP1975647.1 DNA-binding transcriptional LysR family regulator [Cohnella thailandensis]
MLEDMKLFATVVEHTSLNRAAERLNVTQPALSRRIARMERELGVDLFRRIGKRLELTPAGQITYEYAVELRHSYSDYLQKLNAYRSVDTTLATIGASLTTLQTTLPELITAMTEKHPNIEIKAITGKSHEIATLVKEGKVDFGIVASSVEDDPSITSIPLFDDTLMLVLPKTHFYSIERTPFALENLNGLPMILFSPGTWYRTMTDELLRRYGLKPDVRMEIDSFEAIIRLLAPIRAGTLLPKSYIRPELMEDNGLYVIPIAEFELTKRTTSLIHSQPVWMTASTKYLIEETIAYFGRKATSAD